MTYYEKDMLEFGIFIIINLEYTRLKLFLSGKYHYMRP